MSDKNFFIPGGIEYFMPDEAEEFEILKSKVLKIFKKSHYQYVIPPIIDNLPNLLSLNSQDLDQQTLTFVDQMTGKKIGMRADITPQIAKIDQHLSKGGTSRFAYMGDIIRTTENQFDRRNPYQVGCELFGCSNKNHDLEVISQMIEIVRLSKEKLLVLELCDLSIINDIICSLNLYSDEVSKLISLINLKSTNEIKSYLKYKNISGKKINLITDLILLTGSFEIVSEIKKLLTVNRIKINSKLPELTFIAKKLTPTDGNLVVNIDMTNLSNLDYQSSLSFSLYVTNFRKSIANGGRYNAYNSGTTQRLASGFSLDLKDIYFLRKNGGKHV